MPIENCKENNKNGYRYGENGKCYTYENPKQDKEAFDKANKQMKARFASKKFLKLEESKISSLTKMSSKFAKSSLPTIKTPSNVYKQLQKVDKVPISGNVSRGKYITDKISSMMKTTMDGVDNVKKNTVLPFKRTIQKADTLYAKSLLKRIQNTPKDQRTGPAWENLKDKYRNAQGRRITRMGDGVPLEAIGDGSPGLPDIHNVKLSQLSSFLPDIKNKLIL